jgi:radical SAM superfamily enzyme
MSHLINKLINNNNNNKMSTIKIKVVAREKKKGIKVIVIHLLFIN